VITPPFIPYVWAASVLDGRPSQAWPPIPCYKGCRAPVAPLPCHDCDSDSDHDIPHRHQDVPRSSWVR
jgi:hypothetical protein